MKCAKIVTILQGQENISDESKGELSSHNVSVSHYLSKYHHALSSFIDITPVGDVPVHLVNHLS